jgi:replicative DNA helicase
MSELFTHSPLDPSTSAPKSPFLVRLQDLRAAWEADADRSHAAHATGAPRGPVTGLTALDQALGGALSPGLHVLHGQPGTGKTALALQIAAACRCPALLLSLEMSVLELARRAVARETRTFLGRLKSGELSAHESLLLFDQTCAALPNLVLADATHAFADPNWLRGALQAARGDAEHLLLIIDSVHAWVAAAPHDGTEYELLNAGLADLRGVAGAQECAVLAIAERNRASMKTGGLSAGAGTRKFEYGAESVWDLGREPKVVPDAAGEVDVSLTLEKNRNGSAGRSIALKFHGALQRFREA